MKYYFGFEAAKVVSIDQQSCEFELRENLISGCEAGQRYTATYEVFEGFVITTIVIKTN